MDKALTESTENTECMEKALTENTESTEYMEKVLTETRKARKCTDTPNTKKLIYDPDEA
jgi:hypothetical protein